MTFLLRLLSDGVDKDGELDRTDLIEAAGDIHDIHA
jgi:hypothetical protein